MAVEIFANLPSTRVTSGGTTAPAPGTTETWTVASSATFPAASAAATPPTQFHVSDVTLGSEIIAVSNVSGTTWTVTRGAESTTPVAHASGFTIHQVVTAGALAQLARVSWVNAVTEFGATTTGDSTTQIQNALLSFGTLGGWAGVSGTVYLPSGDYSISKPLIIPSGVRLLGDGWGTNIDLITGSNCDIIQFSTYQSAAQAAILGVSVASIANAFYAIVENIQLHGDAFHTTVAGYHHGINITTNPLNSAAPSDPEFDPLPLVRNVWIKGCTGDGINHQGRSGALFERVYSVSNNGCAFAPSYDTTMVDCLAAFCNSGFYLNHSSDVGTGCKSYNNNDYTWVSGHSYAPNNFGSIRTMAISGGVMYFCIAATSGTTPPGSDPAHWTAVSATAPQANGTGWYFDTNTGEHSWAACDAQENSTSSLYFRGPNSGGIIVQATSSEPNFNNGQPAFNTANPNNYAHVVLDGERYATVQVATTGTSARNPVICTSLNAPSDNTLTITTDGSESILFSGVTPTFALVNGQVYTSGTVAVNGKLAIDTGAFSVTPLISSEDGTSTSHGAIVHVLGANNTEFGHYFLWYDATGSAYLGLAMALGANHTYNGHPVIALGGYYNGWGVQGSTNGAGQPIFGVLTSAQSGNGLGATAFTIYDNNTVVTLKNTLDDGSGNASVAGTLEVDGTVTSSVSGGTTFLGKNSGGPAYFTLTGAGDGAQYSNFNLADGIYPLDQNPGGHYWAFSHRVSAHALEIFSYDGAGGYLAALQMYETGEIDTAHNKLDDGAGNMTIAGYTTMQGAQTNSDFASFGNISADTAGKGLRVKEGSNAKQGTATLSGGTVVVSNTSVTANSRIFLTAQDNSTTGALRVSARTPGTSFTITSSNAGDSGVVAYEIFEPG